MARLPRWLALAYATTVLATPHAAMAAPQLRISLPLGRVAYQTNEWVDVAIVRSDSSPLPGGTLALHLSGPGGSRMSFSFAVRPVPLEGGQARSVEYLHLNGWLLRPGVYTLVATAHGATATAPIEVYSHVRKSTFRLIDWGSRAKGGELARLGEDGMGFNLLYADGSGDDPIRGGLDTMGCCVMGGGHQMDLRKECDWSDPYVYAGGTQRVVRAALQYRTRPNAIGVHFYDEPGLTWAKHPVTGEDTPHGVPAQVRAFTAAYGRPPIQYYELKGATAEQAAQWREWARWKLSFMDAAWKHAQAGVSYVRPDFLSVTQSQYAFFAFTDGYYYNVVRSLPVVSGHGGYDDWGPGFFNPSYTLELARARDWDKPCWYLPTWYSSTPSDRFRLEQYLSFMTGIQGLAKPPDMGVHEPASTLAAEGIVESNKAMARLGTIFTTMPVTRPPVAMLFSLSHLIHAQTLNPKICYGHEDPHGQNMPLVYLAGKLIHQPFLPVLDEDVADGTLQAGHRAVVVASVTYLDPDVVAGLEEFAARGGLVLMASDCKVRVRGAVSLGVAPQMPDAQRLRALLAQQRYTEAAPYLTVRKYLEGALPFGRTIAARLRKAGIGPVLGCDNPYITASRQAWGDIEYLFAVNASPDPHGRDRNAIRSASATLRLPADGRPVYDALVGGPVRELKREGASLAGRFRFGPGQMRVFARTARPIGAVHVQTPLLSSNFTRDQAPIRLQLSATLVDASGRILAGSAPLRLRVVDPLGVTRYDVYRATDQGVCRMELPLAANDPAGRWRVVVRDLLANKEGVAAFWYAPPVRCTALAGATPRALLFGNDRSNVHRFFRTHREVLLVRGSSPWCGPAAERLAAAVAPLGVRCTLVDAADVNRARPLSEAEALTWCGIDYAATGQIKPGGGNPPELVGYDIEKPVVLLGTPEDNPLIATVAKHRVLPYTPGPDLPGPGRGLIAWQLDIVARGIESICAIAHDPVGMAEAVGTLFEAAAGLDPLLPRVPPGTASMSPARVSERQPEAAVLWRAVLPDRAVWVRSDRGGRLSVCSLDGTVTTLDASGRVVASRAATAREVAARPPYSRRPAGRLVPKFDARHGERTAVVYWGGTLELLDAAGRAQTRQLLPQDIAALAWVGDRVVVGLADGCVLALATPKGGGAR